MQGNVLELIESDVSFTPYYFYSNFLKRVANYYSNPKYNQLPVEFHLAVNDDIESFWNKFYIDPISIPLVLSLSEQLKNYHNSPLKLHLSNNYGTNKVIEFLFKANFFHLIGRNKNPNYPLGRNIFVFNENYLGGFSGRKQRSDHKVRCYTLNDDNLKNALTEIRSEEGQRDFLVEHFSFKVKEHFFELLFENPHTNNLTAEFIEILAELITNGVLHSNSNAYALMYSDRYKTKFSISDNGIGLYNSLSKKQNSPYYKRFEFFNELNRNFKIRVNENIKSAIFSIFETLYYSFLKDRQGLFDLMCNVVVNCNGYFRLHNDYAQIIISSRMLVELIELNELRNQIIHTHNKFLFGRIDKVEFNAQITKYSIEGKMKFIKLANSIFDKYTYDTRYSSIRFFDVKFRGVHIEVEIPNVN